MLSLDRITYSESYTVARWTFTSLTVQMMLSELLIRTFPSPPKKTKIVCCWILNTYCKSSQLSIIAKQIYIQDFCVCVWITPKDWLFTHKNSEKGIWIQEMWDFHQEHVIFQNSLAQIKVLSVVTLRWDSSFCSGRRLSLLKFKQWVHEDASSSLQN